MPFGPTYEHTLSSEGGVLDSIRLRNASAIGAEEIDLIALHTAQCEPLWSRGALAGGGGDFLYPAVRQCVQDEFDSIRDP